MTLAAYLRILRERWVLVVVVVVLGALAAVGVTLATPTSYQATAQVFVTPNVSSTDPTQQYQAEYLIQTQIATYADTIDSPDLLKQVRRDLNLDASDQTLAAKISASAPSQRSLVDVTATDGTADGAAALANAAANAFVSFIEQNTTSSGTDTPSVRLKVTRPATAPSSPTSPRPTLNIALGVLLGLLAGLALAVARDALDNRIKDAEKLAGVADAPVMGTVVEDLRASRRPVAVRAGAHSLRAENFRQLRANLQFANVDEHPRVIAVTSAVPGEGKTTVALNLASTLAEAGFTVCLVDADLRRPSVASTLGLLDSVGLTNVLLQQIDVSEAVQRAGSNLEVLAAGPLPPNPSEVLASSRVRGVIRSLLDRIDYVVLDTAPLLPVSDGAEVAALSDGALLVARYGETTEPQVRRAVQHMRRVDARLVGVVLNRMPVRRAEYGYSYYRDEPEAAEPGHTDRPRRRRHAAVVEGEDRIVSAGP